MTLLYDLTRQICKCPHCQTVVSKIIQTSITDLWGLIEDALGDKAIKSVGRAEWSDGKTCWTTNWTNGGFTAGDTMEECIRRTAGELGKEGGIP